jgi:serine/threonine-protein kinase
MLSQTAENEGRAGRAGSAVLLLILLALIIVAGQSLMRLEFAYYDFLQGLQQGHGSDRIILLDTSADYQQNLWELDSFPAIVDALNAAGAALIVPVPPPPGATDLPNLDQLTALAELQRRATPDGDGSAAQIALLAEPLEALRRQYERKASIESTVNNSGNLVLALPTIDPRLRPGHTVDRCARHTVRGDAQPADLMNVSGALFLPRPLCDGAADAGYIAYWPDPDGVVRRTHLLANSNSGVFASLALAAARAEATPRDFSVSGTAYLQFGEERIATGPQYSNLNRYYRPADGARPFLAYSPADLLAGTIGADEIRDRIVIIGDVGQGPDIGYRTPVAENVPTAMLIATSLSNLLEMDYVLRPAWLDYAELGLLAFLAILILFSAPSMTANGAALAGLCAGAILLATEAYLLMGPGIWMELVTPTVFAVLGIGSLQLTHRLWPAPERNAARSDAAAGQTLSAANELDLDFSVLRQQAPTEDTKQRLYQIAVAHGRRREFAKAERVLIYLANIDPEYRDVAAKLKKLSGARQAAVAPSVPSVQAAAPQEKSSPRTVRTLGRYEIDRIIGRGAMATVYLGRDPKINRKVAIKTIALAEEFSDADLEEAKAQFLREAESAGRLNHSNIIAIYDVGEDDNVAYLAMEYFEGKSLSDYAQAGNLLPAKWVLELMARAADALHYAHGQKVVHRDIKPANILYHDVSDALKITDFGIARLTDTSRTKTGIILGTPSYMSPEQLSAAAVTGKSDIYSLGVTMYQLLTGAPPFRADSIPSLMEKIVKEQQAPVSSIRGDIPSSVDELLDVALAKNPEQRYVNGRAMALALRDCCNTFAG